MSVNTIPQVAQNVQQNATQIEQSNIEFILPDGIHEYDDPIDKWCVVVGGEIVNYATFWSTAVAQEREALRVRRDHLRCNNLNFS